MNLISHACVWLAVICFAVVLLSGLLMAIDLVRRSKLPSPSAVLSVLSVFAVSLISAGATVVLAEAAKRQSGVQGAVDGVMLFIFCIAGGVMLLLAVGTGAGVLLFIKRRS